MVSTKSGARNAGRRMRPTYGAERPLSLATGQIDDALPESRLSFHLYAPVTAWTRAVTRSSIYRAEIQMIVPNPPSLPRVHLL